MSLIAIYRQHIAKQNFSEDQAQILVLKKMQRIADDLTHWQKTSLPPQPTKSLLTKLFKQNPQTDESTWVKGLYCYGGVGRGKTLLMDLFFTYLPGKRKRRRHFHRFMLEIHEALHQIRHNENPIDIIIKNLAQEIDILCLDEFFVADITDAMLFVRLFSAMKHHGITLVTTSNIAPDELYKNGLQRQQFLPAITWIKDNLVVYHMTEGEDYRHRHFSQENIFRYPDSKKARQAIYAELDELTGHTSARYDSAYYLAGTRKIPTLFYLERGIVFEFDTLCGGNYSQKDYIDIAKRFPYVALVGVKKLTPDNEDAGKRFLLLIDEFYDRAVKLLLTSDVVITDIYQGKKLVFEFERLQSRLVEMQSVHYWQQPHLC